MPSEDKMRRRGRIQDRREQAGGFLVFRGISAKISEGESVHAVDFIQRGKWDS